MSASWDGDVLVLGQIGRPSFKHGAIYEVSMEQLAELLAPHLPPGAQVMAMKTVAAGGPLRVTVWGSPDQGFEMVPEGHPYPRRAFEVKT